MIKIAIKTDYRLPGIYSKETGGPKLNVNLGGNAVVAFVGPAIGSRGATQSATMVGVTPVPLDNKGVIADSYVVVGATSGNIYEQNRAYVATQDAEGGTTISRNITRLSLESFNVADKQFTYYTARPTFNILVDDEGEPIDGHVIRGTVSISGKEEGVDYEIDYESNFFLAKAGGSLVNDEELLVSYSWTTAEPISMLGEQTFSLKSKFIAKDGLVGDDAAYTCKIVSSKYGDNDYGDTPGAINGYEEGIDFVIDYQNGTITRTPDSRIPSFDGETQNYMFIEYGYCAIRDGEQVSITYRYKDGSYGEAKFFSTYNELAAVYGNPWDAETGELVSPISFAAYMASKNGMSYCYGAAVEAIVGTDGSISYPQTSWDAAFDALTSVTGIDIVVPVSGDAGVWASCQEHLAKMKENQDERIAIFGVDGSASPYTSDDMITLANGFSNEDIWLVSPSSFKFRNPFTGVVETVAGYYAAAAVAGYNSSVAQFTPLTRKAVSGFYSAAEYNTKIVKQNQCGNGLMYIDEVSGALRILHGRTTSTASIISQESNIVLTKYYVIKRVRAMFASGFIGSLITPDLLNDMAVSMQSVLNSMYNAGYISNYGNITVEQDKVVPTQANVTFEFRPSYALNYIEISFSIDTTV